MFNANEAKATAKEALIRIAKEKEEAERQKYAKEVNTAYANTQPILEALSRLIETSANEGKTSVTLAIYPYEGVRGLMQFSFGAEPDTVYFCTHYLYETLPKETCGHYRRIFVLEEIEKPLLDAGYRITKKRDKNDAIAFTIKWGWRGRRPGKRA